MTLSAKHILVLGDPIQDIYLHLEPNGVAQEAPVVRFKQVPPYRSEFPGGSSNVAAQVRLLVEKLDWTVREFPGGGIFGEKASRKTRGLVGSEEVFRYDDDKQTPEITQTDLDYLVPGADAVVISDYEKGAFRQQLDWFTEAPLFIDCKNPEKYPRENAIYFPNLREAEANRAFAYRNTLITAGSAGAGLLIHPNEPIYIDSPCPNSRPVSVIGAGDVVVASYTVAHTLGFTPEESARIAVTCASLAVRKPYTPNTTLAELITYSLDPPDYLIQDFCSLLKGD